MSFLGEAPLDYSLPETIELRDLFVLAYQHQAAAEQLAASVKLVPGTFPLHVNMRLTWTELLTVMSNQGRLRALVEKASKDPSASAYHQRFTEMLSENPPLRPPVPNLPTDWWKGDDRQPTVAKKLYFERLLEKRNRLLHVGVARALVEIAPSVGRLEIVFEEGRVHGTGFLIQPNILLTNYHNLFVSEYGNIRAIIADFDDEDGFPGKHLEVKGLIETIHGNEKNDWGIIELEEDIARPLVSLGSIYDVGVNDAVIIIQHPLGGKKQFALDAMAIRFVDDNIVQYVADTQKGSSGSPVFNSRMEVVALHHAEAEITIDLGDRKEVVWRNEGIHINQVVFDLQNSNIPFLNNH